MQLRAENIIKSYRGREVVKGISIELKQGEIVGLLGPGREQLPLVNRLPKLRNVIFTNIIY